MQFGRLNLVNLSPIALNGRTAESIEWQMEEQVYLPTFTYSLMRTNILTLCLDAEQAGLRSSIIEGCPPAILNEQQGVASEAVSSSDLQGRFHDELSPLDADQRTAVLNCILTQNYQLVYGVPGSGKTTSIVVLLRILAKLRKRVLVVSLTHYSIDNVLLRLQATGFNDFVRVTRNVESVHEDIQSNVYSAHELDTMDKIRQVFEENFIYATICHQMNNQLLANVKFDYVVIDESA